MGELFEKSSPTPPQKLSNSNYQNRFVVYKRTDGARINLAFATANGQAPPRPCPLRKLNRCNSGGETPSLQDHVIIDCRGGVSPPDFGRDEEIVLQSLGGLPPSIRAPTFVKNII